MFAGGPGCAPGKDVPHLHRDEPSQYCTRKRGRPRPWPPALCPATAFPRGSHAIHHILPGGGCELRTSTAGTPYACSSIDRYRATGMHAIATGKIIAPYSTSPVPRDQCLHLTSRAGGRNHQLKRIQAMASTGK